MIGDPAVEIDAGNPGLARVDEQRAAGQIIERAAVAVGRIGRARFAENGITRDAARRGDLHAGQHDPDLFVPADEGGGVQPNFDLADVPVEPHAGLDVGDLLGIEHLQRRQRAAQRRELTRPER